MGCEVEPSITTVTTYIRRMRRYIEGECKIGDHVDDMRQVVKLAGAEIRPSAGYEESIT